MKMSAKLTGGSRRVGHDFIFPARLFMPHNKVFKHANASPKLASNDKIGGAIMYAVIATGGKQYKVSEGDIITIEKLGAEVGETVTFDQVLAVNNGELVVGDPTVANATVTASVVKTGRSKKVIVYKYKRKTGYHKKQGHRQSYTRVKIEKING